MVVYLENPRKSTDKLWDLNRGFSKIVGYKLNIQNSIAFLYASNR